MEMNMETKEKEIDFLKIELSKTQSKLSNPIKDLEHATSNCECKKSARKSLSDRRRFEKNILQDSKRNISENYKISFISCLITIFIFHFSN